MAQSEPASRTDPRVRGACVALLVLVAQAGCGDDGGTPPGLGTGGDDMDAAIAIDATMDAAEDTGVIEPPPRDGGRDARVPVRDADPTVDEDAGSVDCGDLDCEALSDECNLGVCDTDGVLCVLQPRADGTACGSDTLDQCTAADTCQAGACVANDKPAGEPCGDQGVACHVDDACDGQGACTDNGLLAVGSACNDTSDDDCSDPDTCDADGICQPNHASVDTPCTDLGQPLDALCNNDDLCDGQGQCIDQGVWLAGDCPMGEVAEGCVCGSTATSQCHPRADVCVAGICNPGNAPNGEDCGDPGDTACDDPDSCLNGSCVQNAEPSGTDCDDDDLPNTVCDRPDTCDGFGTCDPNHADPLTVCDEQPGDCWLEPRCDGGGSCQAAAPASADLACGNQTETSCDHADTCDGAGECDSNLAAPGVACGDDTDGECTAPDSCDGAGACDPNHALSGVACGDQGMSCLNDDSCDGAGVCEDQGFVTPCALQGTVRADGVPVAGVIVEVVGGDAATTDVDGEYEIEVPVQAPFLMRVGDAPGYWGSVRVVQLEPEELGSPLDLRLDRENDIEGVAAAVAPPIDVDDADGMVLVSFEGAAAGDGEGASLSAASEMAIVYVPPETFAYSDENHAAEDGNMFLYNVAAGTVTVTAVDGAANDCALAYTPASGWPVFARTVTQVTVLCE